MHGGAVNLAGGQAAHVNLDNTTLRKIVGRAQTTGSAPVDPLNDALEIALAKIGRALFGLEMQSLGIERRDIDLAGVLAQAPDPGLISVCTAEGFDGEALCLLDGALVNTLVEFQTGAVGEGQPAPLRPATYIDAALCKSVIDELFRALSNDYGVKSPGSDLPVFVHAYHSIEPKVLRFNLPDVTYDCLRFDLGFDSGDAKGAMTLALPKAAVARQNVGDGTQAVVENEWARGLREAVEHAPLRLEAVLYRLSMPLSRAYRLRAGDTVVIPTTSLLKVRLESLDRKAVLSGRLGQINSNRAVRTGSDAEILHPFEETQPPAEQPALYGPTELPAPENEPAPSAQSV